MISNACILRTSISKLLDQVRLGQVRLGQVRLGQVRLGQVRLGLVQVRLGQVRLGQVRLGQVRLGQVRLGQVRLGQVRLGQVRLGQVWFGQCRLVRLGYKFEIPVFKQRNTRIQNCHPVPQKVRFGNPFQTLSFTRYLAMVHKN